MGIPPIETVRAAIREASDNCPTCSTLRARLVKVEGERDKVEGERDEARKQLEWMNARARKVLGPAAIKRILGTTAPEDE